MIKSARRHGNVVTSVYEMTENEMVDWHEHANPHTLEAVKGSLAYQIEADSQILTGHIETGGAMMLPAVKRHRFWATAGDTIALTMIEVPPGSDAFGEPGGVLLHEETRT